MSIRQQTALKISNTDTAITDIEELDPPSPQGISNVFTAADLFSCSSSDSDKYKRAWRKAKVIGSSFLYAS